MENKFVKKSYAPITALYTVFYIIIVTMFIVVAFKRNELPARNIIFLSGLTTLFIPAYLLDKQGVYIKDDGLYYQVITKRKIDIEKIVALRIVKSETHTTSSTYSFVHDNKGSYAYSIIALSKIDETMNNYPYGDMRFVSDYRKYVIFQTIYEQELIDYIIRHNKTVDCQMIF